MKLTTVFSVAVTAALVLGMGSVANAQSCPGQAKIAVKGNRIVGGVFSCPGHCGPGDPCVSKKVGPDANGVFTRFCTCAALGGAPDTECHMEFKIGDPTISPNAVCVGDCTEDPAKPICVKTTTRGSLIGAGFRVKSVGCMCVSEADAEKLAKAKD